MVSAPEESAAQLLNDRDWWSRGERRFRSAAVGRPTAEDLTRLYWEARTDGDAAAALLFAVEALDALHRDYMDGRRLSNGKSWRVRDTTVLDNCQVAFVMVDAERPMIRLGTHAARVVELARVILANANEFGMTAEDQMHYRLVMDRMNSFASRNSRQGGLS